MKSWNDHLKGIFLRSSSDEESSNHRHEHRDIELNQFFSEQPVRFSDIDYLKSTPSTHYSGKLYQGQCFVANISVRETCEDPVESIGTEGEAFRYTEHWMEARSESGLSVLQEDLRRVESSNFLKPIFKHHSTTCPRACAWIQNPIRSVFFQST